MPKKIVALSDRTRDLSSAFEHDKPKGGILTKILTAGTVEPELIEDIRTEHGNIPRPLVRNLVDALTEEFQEIRNARITNEIIKQSGFDSFEDFYSRQKTLHDYWANWGEILLTGVDDKARRGVSEGQQMLG